jgi:hypothetical protein
VTEALLTAVQVAAFLAMTVGASYGAYRLARQRSGPETG